MAESHSALSWLDYSDGDRRRALDVVNLLREPSTVDELGLGLIRDAFADLLFPGTSTIQTRARYFLFVPWIYLDLERLRVASAKIVQRRRNVEIALIEALADSGGTSGVIGIQARKTLQRLPSNIYWNGLLSWGIRRFAGSQPQYHRSLDAFYRSPAKILFDDDRNPVAGSSLTNWDPELPRAPEGFPKEVTLALTRLEAEYLRERILVSHRRSMLAFLVGEGQPSQADNPWEHGQRTSFPGAVLEQLEHAQRFSEAMHGAQLLYNLMLAEAAKHEEWETRYRGALAEWTTLMEKRGSSIADWDRMRFWAIVAEGGGNIRPRTATFVDAWLDLLQASATPDAVLESAQARRLIDDRERQLKRSRARLSNPQALALWQGNSGAGQINYRWPVTRGIVNDVLEGLGA